MAIFDDLDNLDLEIRQNLEGAEDFDSILKAVALACNKLGEEKSLLRQEVIEVRRVRRQLEDDKRTYNKLLEEIVSLIKDIPKVSLQAKQKPKRVILTKRPEEPKKEPKIHRHWGIYEPLARIFGLRK